MIEVVDERRKYTRYDFRVPVQYRSLKALTSPESGAVCRDLGEGGLRLIGNEFLSLSNRVVLTLALPAPSRPIKVIAKVAWIRKIPMGDQYEIGNQFLSMAEEDRKLLKDYLSKMEPPTGS